MRRRNWVMAAWAACLTASAQSRTLRLGAAHWPPYSIRDADPRPGFIHEWVTSLMARLGYPLEVVYLPWSRALMEARQGRLDGVLAAAPSEAAGLALGQVPLFQSEVVFLTRADSSWRYTGSASLNEVLLGVVQDYGYGEPLDSHVAETSGKVTRITGTETVERLAELVRMGRIDAMPEDRLVLEWLAARGRCSLKDLRVAGGLRAQPVFLALHPKRAKQDRLMERIDAELSQPSSRDDLKRLRTRYLDDHALKLGAVGR